MTTMLKGLDFSDLAGTGKPAASIAELDFSDLGDVNHLTQGISDPSEMPRAATPIPRIPTNKDPFGLIQRAQEIGEATAEQRKYDEFARKLQPEQPKKFGLAAAESIQAGATPSGRVLPNDWNYRTREEKFHYIIGQYVARPVTSYARGYMAETLEPLWAFYKKHKGENLPSNLKDKNLTDTLNTLSNQSPTKASDLISGLSNFMGKITLSKAVLSKLGISPKVTAIRKGVEFGTSGALTEPAKGIAEKIDKETDYGYRGTRGVLNDAMFGLLFGGIEGVPKSQFLGGAAGKTAVESGSLYLLSRAGGAQPEDALMQAMIPVAYKALDIALKTPEYVRGKLEDRATKILRKSVSGKGIDLSQVPDDALKTIIKTVNEGKKLRDSFKRGQINQQEYNASVTELNGRIRPIFETIAKQQPVKPAAEKPQSKSTTPATIARPQTTPAAISGKPTVETPARGKMIVAPPIAPKVEKTTVSDLSFGDLSQPQETPKPIPETQPIVKPEIAPTQEVPVWKIKLSRDVPNFKKAASPTTGIIEGEELSGKYERLATAPILVWERENGDMEVITGRHRLDLARRTGEKTIPAQVVKESEGFTKAMALTIDAESNIREGQGGVKDYATYFRNTEITEQEAGERGLLSRSKGEAGFRIGKSAVDDVFATFIGGKLSDTKAAAIATGAPNNEPAQLAAMSKADTMSPDELEQYARILTRSTPSDKLKPRQGNLFGFDDSALQEAEAVAREVGKESASIKERILAVKGALRRPDIARKMGLEFSDEQSIKAEVARLEQRLDDLKRTSTTPALWREMKLRAGLGDAGYSGETPEMFNKADYPVNEPDIPGQQKMALEGPPKGGRETGATSLIPDIASEGLSLGRTLINHPTTLISSTAKMVWRNVRRGTNHIRTLGGAGKLLAKDLEEITFRVTRNVNNDGLDLRKAFAGLDSEQRQTVTKIINERILPLTQPSKLVAKANQVRDVLDRSMKAGAELEMTRKVKGKQLPLAGSGKAYPQVPNKAGVEFLNEAEAKGLGSARVFAWAQEQVKAGNYENVDQAVDALHRFREIHIRGLNPYLEAERVELPDEYIEWDGAYILPHLIEKNWMTVEGVRQWGNNFGRVSSRLEQIRSKYGPKAAKRVETFIATSFGKMSPASTEAQNISNAIRAYQYSTKVGMSPITILRNMFDRFAKMLVISQNPKVVATALKEYPPFANAFIDSARKLEEKFIRAGAVFGHGSIAEGYEPGNILSEIVGKPFSESEKGNQVFIALVRYHQLLKDIDTWQQRKGEDLVTTRLANRLGLALKDPTKYRLQEHGSKILDALEKGEPITDDMINEALHYTVRDKAFPVVLSTKPMWWETQPLLKIFTQFKTWPKEQLGMIWNDVIKYTVKTGDVRRLAGFIVGTILAGELYNIVRDYLYEKDESITSQFFKEDKHWAKAVFNDLVDGGIVGMLADFSYGIYDWAAGPSLSTGRNIREAVVAAYKRPSLTVPAITRLIQQEVTPARQVIKTWDKIDRRFINKRNITKDYFRVRDWAWQYRNGYLEPDMLDKIQGGADDLIYGKVRYKPGDNTLAYQMAARQIMVGDIEDARAYFKNIIENSEEKDTSKLISTIERTMKSHYSPYGHILDEKEADFLIQLPEKERGIAKNVQEQWQKNMAESLYSLMSEKDLRIAIIKNTSHDIDRPETYNRPHKGKEARVKQWRDELRRRQGMK
ncbi:MAG: hypothetical protein ABII09_10970 [Planctomycetota bacterium]